MVMEYKKQGDIKPRNIIRLEEAVVEKGKSYIGEENTIAILLKKSNPIFLKASSNDSFIGKIKKYKYSKIQ